MDTREKILDWPLGGGAIPADAVYVTGCFDPLVADHAGRLEEAARGGRAVVVVVTEPETPVLDKRARAELVASLRCVHRVILIPEEQLSLFLSERRDLQRGERDDDRIRQELIRLVHRRQNGK